MPPLMPTPPPATPLAPTPGAGMESQARVEMASAVKALIRALGVLKDVRTEEAKACLSALKALEKVAPDVDDGVSTSELASQMAGAQGVKPGAGAMMGGGGMGLGRPPSPQPMSFGMNSPMASPSY